VLAPAGDILLSGIDGLVDNFRSVYRWLAMIAVEEGKQILVAHFVLGQENPCC